MDDLPKGQLRIAIRMIAILMMYPIIVLMSKLHCVFNLDLYSDLYLKFQLLKPVLPINFWRSPLPFIDTIELSPLLWSGKPFYVTNVH
jgi:hypothetical protein